MNIIFLTLKLQCFCKWPLNFSLLNTGYKTNHTKATLFMYQHVKTFLLKQSHASPHPVKQVQCNKITDFIKNTSPHIKIQTNDCHFLEHASVSDNKSAFLIKTAWISTDLWILLKWADKTAEANVFGVQQEDEFSCCRTGTTADTDFPWNRRRLPGRVPLTDWHQAARTQTHLVWVS